GPTEAAVEATLWGCRPGSVRVPVPIGRPIANTAIHVLDPGGWPVPAGISGELHIGGINVGRGYLSRPDLTAERFVPDPFGAPGSRLYRTGDLARFAADGAVELLGRKVDRKVLPAPEQPGVREGYVAPRTRKGEILATVWAQVLRLPRVGVNDNFFELGGDSILSVQIVVRARQAGLHFTLRQIFKHLTVAELARHATATETAGAARAGQGPVAGEVPLTPIQRWFFAQGFADPHHFNQTLLLESREPLAPAALERAMAAIVEHHDALRLRFHVAARDGDAGGWRQENAPAEPV